MRFTQKGNKKCLFKSLPGGMTRPLVMIVNLEFVQTPEREIKSFTVDLPSFRVVYVCMIYRSALLIRNPSSYSPVSFNLCVLFVHFFDPERTCLFMNAVSTSRFICSVELCEK